ncbi:MAG: hypothetical protein MHM6MM_007085 [Cercozoa sp. M6MM]
MSEKVEEVADDPSHSQQSKSVTSVLAPVLASVLAPDSLVAEDTLETSPRVQKLTKAVRENTKLLQEGDLILVQTPGRLYRLARRLVRTKFDHVAVVVNEHSCLHIGPARTRLLPVALFVDPKRKPHVLRPQLSDTQRQHFVEACRQLEGQPYDTLRLWSVVARLTLRTLGVRPPPLKAILTLGLDYTKLNAASANDFVTLLEARPDLLKAIELPLKSLPAEVREAIGVNSPRLSVFFGSHARLLNYVRTHFSKHAPAPLREAAQSVARVYSKLPLRERVVAELLLLLLYTRLMRKRRRLTKLALAGVVGAAML